MKKRFPDLNGGVDTDYNRIRSNSGRAGPTACMTGYFIQRLKPDGRLKDYSLEEFEVQGSKFEVRSSRFRVQK